MTTEQALRKLRGLEWTQEVRPGHPWSGDIMVRRSEVEQILRGEPVTRAPIATTGG